MVCHGVYQKGGETMITKIRTNIFLTETELKKLRALSRKTGAPVAVLVRRAIDEYLAKQETDKRRK
jgi:predicted DNA-binding protein